jgi:hypothetical protein
MSIATSEAVIISGPRKGQIIALEPYIDPDAPTPADLARFAELTARFANVAAALDDRLAAIEKRWRVRYAERQAQSRPELPAPTER